MNIIMRSKNRHLLLIVLTYIVLGIFFFLPYSVDYKIVFPLLFLTIMGLSLLPVTMILAMSFSFFGDFAGAVHNFYLQMGCFAIAHIAFICYFLSLKEDTNIKRKQIFSSVISSIMFVIVTLCIISHIQDPILLSGVSLYSILIIIMFMMSCYTGRKYFIYGALLFITSDTVLAFNKFVENIPYSTYYIMVPYYTSQILLFFQASKIHLVKVYGKCQ